MIAKNNLFWFLFWFWGIGLVQAQVPNDNIENRRRLKAEEVVFSNTIGCTVQRSCVDESLTGKCVQYHNDQWFEFTPETPGDYFVNISGQNCRDTRGVQLVILTGEPCKTETYQILSCTSLASQDDIFVKMEALQAGKPYLLNVDGYLHDACSFQLKASTRSAGMPAVAPPPIPLQDFTTSAPVTLRWHLPDSVSASIFKIMRREDAGFRAEEIGTVTVSRDSYGKLLRDYTFTDTLPKPGNYLYQILANGSAEPVLLHQEWKRFRDYANTPKWYQVPLEKYPNKAELAIAITDAATGKMLQRAVIRKQKNKPRQGHVLINNWQAAGIQTIRVEIQERKKGRTVSTATFLVPLED